MQMYASLHFIFKARSCVQTRMQTDQHFLREGSGAGSGLSLVRHTLLRPGGVRQQEYRLKTRDPATEQIVPYLIYTIVTCWLECQAVFSALTDRGN